MQICVTGACGFIGGELIKRLNKLGYNDIIAIDHKDKPINTEYKIKRFIDWEFIYENKYFDFLNLVNITYHIGANSSTRATKEEVDDCNTNFSILFMTENNLRGIPFIFSSSASVYGARRKKDKVAPQSPYAKSKLMFDDFIDYFPLNNIVSLRYHNVYGATESHKGNMASIINKWIDNHFKGINTNPLFLGSENIKRDFISVDDVTDIHIMLLDYYKKNDIIPYGIYDVGVGKSVSFKNIADTIVALTKGTYDYVENPYDETNYQFFTKADIDKISELYFTTYKKPFYPIDYKNGIRMVFNTIKESYESKII